MSVIVQRSANTGERFSSREEFSIDSVSCGIVLSIRVIIRSTTSEGSVSGKRSAFDCERGRFSRL